MSKTLVVSYLPNPYSVTKQVLDHFTTQAQGQTELVHRDLLTSPPPVFDQVSMVAYQRRGFMGQTLEGEHAEAIRPFDTLIDEIAGVDNVVFAFPTHNWSEPGVVKTYIDAILQAGRTIFYDAQGKASGALKNHKALVVFASGMLYDEGHPRRTIQNAFTFYLNAIGITDVTFAPVGGTLLGADTTAKSVQEANAVVDQFAARLGQPAKATA